jgi:hypothetical protein
MQADRTIGLTCVLVACLALCSCESDDSNGGRSTPTTSGTAGAGGSTSAGGAGGTGSGAGGPGGAGPSGAVDFVPIYETGSAWETNTAAKQMVDSVFADFEATLRTSGDWDATIEVYLSDDNPANANTTFEATFVDAVVDGQTVRVVPAWNEIVRGAADANGPAQPNGSGAEYAIHFNVSAHADNAGLLRHEMMHGLGAVNSIPNITVTSTGTLGGPMPGERTKAALYDLQLVDLSGNPLLANYSASDDTFEVQPYNIEPTLVEWMDGDAGVFFRGAPPGGGALDMACGTFPVNSTQGRIGLNEPAELMSASAHPTWNTIDEPDRAFFSAMGYNLAP